ncbi:biotin--[acetyl-CoA-carboxylase] ligase [Portibacter marinus]|uniref:biotin--[acetyl-CoA-carboxylase] ligase n=1 Tax=Portibacter marinus TaxID=2898660 RepID=UPI001F3D842D|nr:biotin--[acetyl-CoA-carboxylase] ligase [Portibacter marinus]
MPTKLDSLFAGAKHYHFKETDSTNKYALNLISKNAPAEGTVISADFQTYGRGQYGRQWMSESTKNLLSSIILYPEFLPVHEQFSLSKAISLAVQNTLHSFLASKEVKIKWPNDIYCGPKKIGGILIQNIIAGSRMNASVIGLGINVNQKKFPADLNATSLALELGVDFDKRELLDFLLVDIKTEYMLLQRNLQIQDKRYNDHLYAKNEIRFFEDQENNLFSAKVLFVNREGNLIVEQDGAYKAYSFGELKWV